jgi:hypothetical protein
MNPQHDGVRLRGSESAASLLHAVLREAGRRFPRALVAVRLPESPEAFRARFSDLVPRFEVARTASRERMEIARCVVDASRDALCLHESGIEQPLREALAVPAEPLPLELRAPRGATQLEPAIRFGTRTYRGRQLRELADRLRARQSISAPAARALAWLAEQPELDLSARRFALLGAAAELAPTRLLLEGGADVLWIDVQPPPAALLAGPPPRGRLLVPTRTADLLRQPREIAATLQRWAEAGPLDLGLYAYARGEAREWRLAAAMNAIVESLDPAAVRSASLLVSPTSPLVLEPSDVKAAELRRAARPAWQALLEAAGALGSGAHAELGAARVMRAVVALQGASYQAAQYVEKILSSELWAERGLRVSANVAGVTRTRSLAHPVFEAAFDGARAFGVETFAPETTRALSGLLTLHDLLREDDVPVPLAVRVHGGLHVLPYPVDAALRVAAAIGLVRHPRHLFGLMRARRRGRG